VTHRRADAGHLVRGDRSADARAAHHDAALSLALLETPAQLAGDVREIHRL